MKKRYGQHFLHDRNILRRIVEFAEITHSVIEIGPGEGTLTCELASRAERVIAIEIDRDLIPRLRASMPSNVEIIEGDALDVAWPAGVFQVVGNLPYNVATPLLKRFIENRSNIHDVTIMVQKEVAERLMAAPKSRDYGGLSVFVQYYATVEYGFTVPPGAFKPHPKVESAVIRLKWKPAIPDATEFTTFVQQSFSSRRKKLANNLIRMFGSLGRHEILSRIEAAGISTNARPEDLSVDEFLRVYNQFR